MTSRYAGTCADCGATINIGDPILWLSRGTVVCADCDAAGYTNNGQPIAAAATARPIDSNTISNAKRDNDPTGSDAWLAALDWDSTKPQAGASIGQQVSTTADRKPDSDPHAASNRLIAAAVKRDPTIAPTVETKPAELNATRVLKTIQADRPELNQAAAIVADMLVTLVNAIDRLDIEQCESIAAHCLHYANETASGSRRRIWQQFARTIH